MRNNMETQVVKKDGRVEEFDQDKIARVVTAAGLKPMDGFDLATKVARWVKENNKDKITTLQIRDKVVEELQKIDQNAANLFIWYERTKEKAES